MTATVLFVDDEPHILSGLRRMLRGHAGQWELLFADSGEEALRIIDERSVDAVVSDMRMPGIDGARLLSAVQERRPAAARLILSGQADKESVLAALTAAQQFLAKPCDAEVLIAAIDRALAVRRLLGEPRLRELFGGLGSLPKPPDVYTRLIEAASATDCQLADVATVITTSVAASAELLKLVNTAFFGLPRQVDTVEAAVNLLGLDTIQHLVLASGVFCPRGTLPTDLDTAALQRTGLRRAAMARQVAAVEGWDQHESNLVVLAALMRDLGLLVLAQANPTALAGLDAPRTPRQRAQAEFAAFGATVPEASAYLLGLWGFADLVVHTVAGQPVDGHDVGASPTEHALDAVHRRATWPDQPIPPSGGYLDAERARRWNAACAAVLTAESSPA